VTRLAETEVRVLTVARRNDNEMKVVDNRVEDVGHSFQQGVTKPGHNSPQGGGPTRDMDQATQALTLISSSSSGLYSDFGPRSAGEYGPIRLRYSQ
jgi:hypothetical protein